MILRPLPLSEHQTSPFPPLSLLYPPTSRPAGVRFDRPRNPLLLAASHPSQRPDAGEGPATETAPEPAQVPQSPRHPPGRNAHILPAAPEPAQMLQTPLTCIDAMIEPSPPTPARPETQGAELPCLRHAAGAQHPGRGGRGLQWEGEYARGLAGALGARRGRRGPGSGEWRCPYVRSHPAPQSPLRSPLAIPIA